MTYQLTLLNEVERRIKAKLKDRVCQLEQQAREARDNDYLSLALEYKGAARELDLFRHTAGSVITDIFINEIAELRKEAPLTKLDQAPAPKGPQLPKVPDLRVVDTTAT